MAPKFSDDRISGFLDGVLPTEEAAELRREIARDPELKQLVEELRQARGEVQALPRHRLGADFTARVMAAVAEATPPAPIAAKPTPAVKVTAPSKPWKSFALGALAASLVGVAVFVFTPPAKGPAIVENDPPAVMPLVQPVTSGTITLDELKSALASSNKLPGQLFTARVRLKASDLKDGEFDKLLAAQKMVVTAGKRHPDLAPVVAKVWDELSADRAAGLTDALASIREVYYVEADPQAIDAAVAALQKQEAVQLASTISRLPAGGEMLLHAARLVDPREVHGESVSNDAGKPAAGSAVRVGRKQIFQVLGREDANAAANADGSAEVLLMIRVR